MIVVVGAGPAGIAAALRARECGAEVTVLDDNVAAGGQIWRGETANSWVTRLRAAAIPVVTQARVVGGDASRCRLLVETPEGSEEMGYSGLVLATGSRELFLPFPGWTLPGVFGAGGLQALAKCGLPVRGKRIVVGGTGPLLLAVAAFLRKCGADVRMIAEQARRTSLARFGLELLRHPKKTLQGGGLAWELAGIPYRADCWIEAAHGSDKLRAVSVRQGGKTWVEECDYAAVGYGLTPNDELARYLGESPEIYVAGTGEVELSLVEGEIAGFRAAGETGRAVALEPKRARARRFAEELGRVFRLREELKSLPAEGTIVCRCEDVNFGQLQGFTHARAAKLHTRCGMGPCQGRVCGPATQFLFGWEAGTLRPPLFPARIGSLVPATKE